MPRDVDAVVQLCIEHATFEQAADSLHMDCLFASALGNNLIRAIARMAVLNGCTTVEWQTPIWNEEATRSYERLGAIARIKARFRWKPGMIGRLEA